MKLKNLCIFTLVALSSSAIAQTNAYDKAEIDFIGRIGLKLGSIFNGQNKLSVKGLGFDLLVGEKNFPLYAGISIDIYGRDDKIIKPWPIKIDKSIVDANIISALNSINNYKLKAYVNKIDIELKLSAIVAKRESLKVYINVGAGTTATLSSAYYYDKEETQGYNQGYVLSLGITANYNFISLGFGAKVSEGIYNHGHSIAILNNHFIWLTSIGVQF